LRRRSRLQRPGPCATRRALVPACADLARRPGPARRARSVFHATRRARPHGPEGRAPPFGAAGRRRPRSACRRRRGRRGRRACEYGSRLRLETQQERAPSYGPVIRQATRRRLLSFGITRISPSRPGPAYIDGPGADATSPMRGGTTTCVGETGSDRRDTRRPRILGARQVGAPDFRSAIEFSGSPEHNHAYDASRFLDPRHSSPPVRRMDLRLPRKAARPTPEPARMRLQTDRRQARVPSRPTSRR
jgi:hypothetical protein